MEQPEQTDVLVIGSGVVGAFASFYAIKNQLKVTILERNIDVSLGSTCANPGVVYASLSVASGSVKDKFVTQGNRTLFQLAPFLNYTTEQSGGLVVCMNEDENEQKKQIENLHEQLKARGIPTELRDEEWIGENEPNLSSNIKVTLEVPEVGVIAPHEVVLAVIQTCTASGVDLRLDREVRAIKKVNDGYEVHAYNLVKFHEEVYKAKVIINAAGLYADKIAQMVDPKTTIKIMPRRGEEYILKKDVKNLVKRVIISFPVENSKNRINPLIVPAADGRILLGPTDDPVDDPENKDTTISGFQRILKTTQAIVPSIIAPMIGACFAGVQAADVSGDFVINEKDGFINLAGMQSPALTAAPAIGEFVCKEFLSKHFDLKPNGNFKLVPFKTRFHRADLALKNEYVKSDANYARVVCMCEMVTEADIHNAITEGARSLDGIKFRTRMGMGDCQGGLCTTKAIQLLSERLGVDQNQITKRGRGTEMIANAHSLVGGNDPVSSYQPETDAKPLMQTMDTEEMKHILDESYADILIIGAGPAGLGAGLAARKQDPSKSVLLLDRSTFSGGILRQCIHAGFGLKRYRKELTGPEYAEMLTDEAIKSGCHILLLTVVLSVQRLKNNEFIVNCTASGLGVKKFHCRSLVTATGCRERTRPEVCIAGPRPSGVYTAGLAQMMINMRGQVPKGRVVILGSGDIGLIMARRCTLEGIKVLGVYELLPVCSGLRRNVIQCLEDFNIPLHLSTTVVKVVGKDHLEGVKVAKVDPKTLVPDLSTTQFIECEYLILTVGLIQQTRLLVQAGGEMDLKLRSCKINGCCEVKDGAFGVGNCLAVHDLADDAVEEGLLAGKAAAYRLSEKAGEIYKQMSHAPVECSDEVCFLVPHQVCFGPAAPQNQHLAMRLKKEMGNITIKAFYGDTEVGFVQVKNSVPAKMINLRLNHSKLEKAWVQDQNKSVHIKIIKNNNDIEEPEGMQNATCTGCPNSCTVWGRIDENGKVVDIHGNGCPRGARYIQTELTAPVRTISMGVTLVGSRISNRISVKPDHDIPKDRVLELAEHCRHIKVHVGVHMGDCVEENALGGLCNIISCSTVLE